MKAKRTHEEMEVHMEKIFHLMDHKVAPYRDTLSGFNQGHSMHEAALKVAPIWLQKWDAKHRWCICFTQGWSGLVVFAGAFGWSKSLLLTDLIYYESLEEQNA